MGAWTPLNPPILSPWQLPSSRSDVASAGETPRAQDVRRRDSGRGGHAAGAGGLASRLLLQHRTLFYTGANRTIPHVLYLSCFVYNCHGFEFCVFCKENWCFGWFFSLASRSRLASPAMGTGDAGGFAGPVPSLVSLPAPGTAERRLPVQHLIFGLISTSGSAGTLRLAACPGM